VITRNTFWAKYDYLGNMEGYTIYMYRIYNVTLNLNFGNTNYEFAKAEAKLRQEIAESRSEIEKLK